MLERARSRFEVVPTSPPAISGNPLTPEKVELGKMLFFDPRLSRSWLISCNTCQAVAVMGVSQLGSESDEDEVDAITSFPLTLTGTQPKVEYPILPPHTGQTPLPESGPTAGGGH